MLRTSLFLPVFFLAIHAHADNVQYLAKPEQSLATFDSLITGAKSTIDIATFIYEPCDTSARVLTRKLIAKAKAGVHVRVLLDALEQSFDQRQQIENEFAQNGIELRFYSNSLLDIDLRMHAKFTIIDGQTVIAGGRNIADEYFDLSSTLNYVDRDYTATGVAGTDAEVGFNMVWNSDMVSPANPPSGDPVDWNSFCGLDLNPAITTLKNYLKQNEASILAGVPVHSCTVSFNVDNPDFYKADYGPSWQNGDGAEQFMTTARLNRKNATNTVLSFLAGTNQTLAVENYEYIPITQLEKAFKQLRKKNVQVHILTNQDIENEGPDFYVQAQEYELQKRQAKDDKGPETIDLVSSQGALSAAYQLTPQGAPTFIHGKTMVRDNTDVLVGSFNLDARSANINVETASVITGCPDLAAEVQAGSATISSQYQTDLNSPNPPPKPDPSPFAQWFGDMFLSQF